MAATTNKTTSTMRLSDDEPPIGLLPNGKLCVVESEHDLPQTHRPAPKRKGGAIFKGRDSAMPGTFALARFELPVLGVPEFE